jgi:nickel/cobalt exporter
MMQFRSTSLRRRAATILLAALLLFATTFAVSAHPLGNFTINHFARIEVGDNLVRLRFVVDMAEIPTFQELRAMTAGESDTPSAAALDVYLQRVAAQYADGLAVMIDGSRVPLKKGAATIKTLPGAGGLQTLRVECDYEGAFPTATDGGAARHLRFEDLNNSDRIGWHEIVVVPSSGISIFNSSAFANGVTDEIKAYPQDMLLAPLNERVAELSFTRGAVPSGAHLLSTREGRPFVQERDRFSELINVKELTPTLALLGLLIAVALGAVHALSPGHGKTIVGAYLIGSRGTARHAVFLGLTVTITHTIGVFALGLVTLFASQYIVPERLFPVLGLISGALVFVVGLSLFIRRLRAALKPTAHDDTHHHHHHDHAHHHDHGHHHAHHAHDHLHADEHDHSHAHSHDHAHTHSHGGSTHTHLPPGAGGDRVAWRSLLALGISGGLLPCPSALVVMLSAIALHRVAYGLILVVAFSFGLACTLTCIGLAFVYAGRLMKGRINQSGRALRWLPAMSAFVIACLGAVICYQALGEAGIHPLALLSPLPGGQIISLSTFGVLVLVLVFGLKYAVEAQRRGAQRKVK